MENKKILILVLPTSGHTNPVISVAKELTNRKAHVIFYSKVEYKEKILQSGSEFREYPYFELTEVAEQTENKGLGNLVELMNSLQYVSERILLDLVKVVDDERPDLILYEKQGLHARYLMRYLKNRHKSGKSELPVPLGLYFSSTFVFENNIYPSPDLAAKLFNTDFEKLFSVFKGMNEKQKEINAKFDLDIDDVIQFMQTMDENKLIVSVFPELHPMHEKFDERYEFVGCCISETIKTKIENPILQSFLDEFKPINPIESINQLDENELKLVFVSMGTMFTNNFKIMSDIITAMSTFDKIDEKLNSGIKASNLRVIVSLGDKLLNEFERKIKNNEFQLPNNTLLLAKAPQIEILKRAHLFVTHCGMNSTSETIHYGVPTVCIPLDSDQPYVGFRICDELNLGVRLKFDELNIDFVRNAIHEVLKNKVYAENMIKYSKISRKFDGIKNSADVIQKYLNQ